MAARGLVVVVAAPAATPERGAVVAVEDGAVVLGIAVPARPATVVVVAVGSEVLSAVTGGEAVDWVVGGLVVGGLVVGGLVAAGAATVATVVVGSDAAVVVGPLPGPAPGP